MTHAPAGNTDPRIALAGTRTRMAGFRTSLALDRTMLAWIRTTLTMATFGFGLIGFFRSLRQSDRSEEAVRLHEGAITFGESLLVLAIAATIVAGVAHLRTLRRLRRGEAPALSAWPLSVTVAFLVTIAGMWGLWTVMTR
jgi:uncharacterized membrane protein YidH (DUF202 family)